MLGLLVAGPAKGQGGDVAKTESSADMVERVQRSIFRIVVARPDGTSTGTGFFIREDGLAVTNYHVVVLGLSAHAETTGGEKFSLELVAVNEGLDLALVKALPSPGDEPVVAVTVKPALKPARPAEDVWAVGFPSPGLTVTRGIVSAIRRAADQPEDAQLRRLFSRLDPSASLIQTDCTLNHGNSGGPLVNAQGEVVGVTTWVDPSKNQTFYATAIQHAVDFAAGDLSVPLTFARFSKNWPAPRQPDPTVPHAGSAAPTQAPRAVEPGRPAEVRPAALDLSGLDAAIPRRDGSSSRTRQAFIRLREGIKCPTCRGAGSVTIVRQVPATDMFGTGYLKKTKAMGQCSECSGSGLASPHEITLLLEAAFEQLAQMRAEDSKRNEVVEFAVRVITEQVHALPGERRAALRIRPTPQGGGESGRGVFVLGVYLGPAEAKGSNAPVHVFECDDGTQVCVADAIVARVRRGERASIGGALWGTSERGGRPVTVLRFGLVLAE